MSPQKRMFNCIYTSPYNGNLAGSNDSPSLINGTLLQERRDYILAKATSKISIFSPKMDNADTDW